MTIIEKLEDLLLQATLERSHYYVASVCRAAIAEINRLQEFERLAPNMLAEIERLHEIEWMYKELCR